MNTNSTPPEFAALSKPIPVRTPPESPTLLAPEDAATLLPISPPATVLVDSSPRSFPRRVRYLLNRIRQLYQGRLLEATWECVHIQPYEYQALQDALQRDTRFGAWVADKLRYDYNPVNSEFVLRMPSPLHDLFAIRLQEVIVRELKGSMGQEQVRLVAERIKIAGTSDVQLGGALARGKKSPDGSFRFDGAKYPPLVIEVANSQKNEDLPRLAETYIEHTKGRTKTVVTVGLEYRNPSERAALSLMPRSAVYSIYRNRLVRDEQTGNLQREAHAEVEDQRFRMDDLAAPAGSMRLLLSDFCPDRTLSETDDVEITISHAELAKILTEAERDENVAEIPSSPVSSETDVPFVSKRKRTPTPKLASEDEATFEQAEATAMAREEAENSSFSSADVENIVVERNKRAKTRSQPDREASL